MVMLINGIISIFSPEVTFSVTFLMTMIMQAILNTLLFLILTAVFLWTYNFLGSLGIRVVTVELEDKE